MKHLLDVRKDNNLFSSEADQNSQKRIVKVWAGEEHIIQRATRILGTRVKHHSDLAWLLWMIDTESWQVPAFFIVSQWWGLLSMAVLKNPSHESDELLSHLGFPTQCALQRGESIECLLTIVG